MDQAQFGHLLHASVIVTKCYLKRHYSVFSYRFLEVNLLLCIYVSLSKNVITLLSSLLFSVSFTICSFFGALSTMATIQVVIH